MNGESRSIMIVEDEKIVARDLAMIVRNLGYKVTAVLDNGQEALQAVAQNRPDLVLMDVVLPGEMDGIDTASRLRQYHSLPVVFVTAFADQETVRRARKTDPHGYILKPYTEQSIQSAIEIALHKAGTDAKLEMQERLLSTILKTVESAVIAVDREGVVQFVNLVATQLTGWTDPESKGRNIADVLRIKLYGSEVPRSDLLEVLDDLARAADGPRELVIVDNDGNDRTVECVIRRNETEHALSFGFVITFRDITERKLMQAQLLKAKKMEALGILAGGMAHGFNNMLGVILSFAELIEQNSTPGDIFARSAGAIADSAHRCRDLTAMLISLAGKEIVHPAATNVNSALALFQAPLAAIASERITLRVDPGADLWNILIDVNQVHQILAILATNAREAIFGEGSILIETRNVVLDEESCRMRPGSLPGEKVMLAVTDTGRGMDEALIQRIFDPFFSTKAPGTETGLGLAVVFGIVKQNSGWIEVESAPGRGTSFRIFFPKTYRPLVQAARRDPEREPGGTETILLVEDEVEFLELMAAELGMLGYRVLAADSAENAIALWETHHETIDILVTDRIMPGRNGRELIEHCESMRPGLRSIVISGYTADIVARDGIVEDGLNFVQKPFTPLMLARKVREVLDTPRQPSDAQMV